MSVSQRALLLVEDESAIRRGLRDLFEALGYRIALAKDGPEGLKAAREGKFDAILLDVMLPGMDGFSVCKALREEKNFTPILMLTAKGQESDKVRGLTVGADDYVTKPFSVKELAARVEALLRRVGRAGEMEEKLTLGKTVVDFGRLKCRRGQGEEELTKREVEILRYLMARPARAVSREELLHELWGYPDGASIETRTVDIHLAKLRQKIEEDAANPRFIVTVRGEGYRFAAENAG